MKVPRIIKKFGRTLKRGLGMTRRSKSTVYVVNEPIPPIELKDFDFNFEPETSEEKRIRLERRVKQIENKLENPRISQSKREDLMEELTRIIKDLK